MSKRFSAHKKFIALLEAAELLVLPTGGVGWVQCVGNRNAPRGYRIARSHAEQGVEHRDIYLAFDERPAINKLRAEQHSAIRRALANVDGLTVEQLQEAVFGVLNNHPFGGSPDNQVTQMSLVTPYSHELVVYNGEVHPVEQDHIQELLSVGAYEVQHFTQNNIVLDEAVRDIIDALQVDGLSYYEAQSEALTQGVIKKDEYKHPNWFYRAVGWYKNQFVESHAFAEASA